MGIFEIFNCIYGLENKEKLKVIDNKSGFEFEAFVGKNEKGLFFDIESQYVKMFCNDKLNFKIEKDNLTISINHYLLKNPPKSFEIKLCEAYIFQSLDFNDENEKYFCYFSKIENYFLISFLEGNKTDFSINVDSFKFNIKTVNINPNIKHSFLYIECENKMEFKTFKNYVNTIITAIGFFSGNFYKKEEFYFQSELKDYSNETNFFYRSSDKKHNFPKPFTKFPSELIWKFKEDYVLSKDLNNKWISFIDENVFELLVKLLIDKPKIYLSIRIIFDFYNYPSISRVSLMFVVLETLCEELNTKTDSVQKELKKDEAFRILKEIEDKISLEAYLVIDDVIKNIDCKLTNNTVHFEETFKSLKISLSNEDRGVLRRRNDFFHGRIIPDRFQINSEEEFVILEKKYNDYSLRIFVLISKIILKSVKFTGHLINYPKLFEDYNDQNIGESYFVEIKK